MNKSFESKYVLPKKGEHIRNIYEKGIPCVENLKVEEYENAIVLPYRRDQSLSGRKGWGGVIDSNNNYVELSAHPLYAQAPYTPEECEHEEATVVYLGFFFRHWGHFLIDDISRLWYAVYFDSEKIDYYIFTTDDKKKSFYPECIEFFKYLGIEDKVKLIDKAVEYSKVIVPQLGYLWGHFYSMEWLKLFEVVRENALKQAIEYKYKIYDRIYLDRHKFEKPNISHKELTKFWKLNHYHVVCPNKISLTELIWYLNNANKIVIDSGTIAHQMLFCEDGRELVICERSYWINTGQTDIDIMKQLQVTYIDSYLSVFPWMVGPFFYCYDQRLDSYAIDNGMKRLKILPERKITFRRYLKKYTYCWGYSALNTAPDNDCMEEFSEALAYYKKEYSWMKMRPLTTVKRVVRAIISHGKPPITYR